MTTLLHVLQHAIGRDEFGRPTSRHNPEFRNHYCCGPGHDGFEHCRKAVADGLMTERGPRAISGGDHTFFVTVAGRAWIAEHSPKPPKVSRSKARYRAYLDADTGETFGEWLKRCAS